MIPFKLLNNEDDVRQRKGTVTGIVKELDVFIKVVDDVKEEPKVTNGICKFSSK